MTRTRLQRLRRSFAIVLRWALAVAAVGFVALWVRSHIVSEMIYGKRSHPEFEQRFERFLMLRLSSCEGQLGFQQIVGGGPPPAFKWVTFRRGEWKWRAITVRHQFLGFEWLDQRQKSRPDAPGWWDVFDWSYGFAMPYWSLVLATGAWPAWCGVAWLRAPRSSLNHCSSCGYDLRATPDADGPKLSRCPECGRETVHPET